MTLQEGLDERADISVLLIRIAEKIVDAIVDRIIYPLVRFLLTREYRKRLEQFEKNYLELRGMEIASSVGQAREGMEEEAIGRKI